VKSQVRFGCRIFLSANEPFQHIVQRAQLCEKHGFDSVLIDDHPLYGTEAKQQLLRMLEKRGGWKILL